MQALSKNIQLWILIKNIYIFNYELKNCTMLYRMGGAWANDDNLFSRPQWFFCFEIVAISPQPMELDLSCSKYITRISFNYWSPPVAQLILTIFISETPSTATVVTSKGEIIILFNRRHRFSINCPTPYVINVPLFFL